LVEDYRFKEIEEGWEARWEAEGLGELDLDGVSRDRKFYNLVEFPYPSAEGLHVGHAFTYSGADAYGRYQRMCGRAVFQPIGFDSFGIHTENYALRVGERPDRLTARTMANYSRQPARDQRPWLLPLDAVDLPSAFRGRTCGAQEGPRRLVPLLLDSPRP
jgi:leucyl-tRNA synthetase